MPTVGSTSSIRKFPQLKVKVRYFRTGLYPSPKTPLTLGREGAGIVTAVGEGVTNFQQGDRVAYMGMEVTPYLMSLISSRMRSTL